MSRLSGREQAVWDKRNAGLTFKQIAKDLGLCPATVSFAYGKAYRKIEYEKERLKPTELEVYKRALNEAVGEIDLALEGLSDCHMDDWGYENLHTETNYFLDQARKELEDDE